MKNIILITLLLVSLYTNAQEDTVFNNCATLPPDSLQSMSFAYFGNNEVLDSVLNLVGYYDWLDSVRIIKQSGKTQIRTNSEGYLFNIPVTIWDYHDDDGSNEAYPESKILEVLKEVNALYDQNHTGIHFFLACPIIHVNSTKYNYLSGHLEFFEMVLARKVQGTLNWHMVSRGHKHASGEAISPFLPQNYSFFAAGQKEGGSDSGIISVVSIVAHEIGHTFGLLHTHHGGKLPWWDNKDIPWGLHWCYQEPADHSRINKPWQFCGWNYMFKCALSGDFLCDTQGTPTADRYGNSNGCQRVNIYQDRWGDDFPSEPRNIMSYIDAECELEFTNMQLGVMFLSLIVFPNSTYGTMNQWGWWLNGTHTYVHGTANNGDVEGVANYHITSPTPNDTYTVEKGADVSLLAGNSIELNPGTDIQKGAIFRANIDLFWLCIIETIHSGGRVLPPIVAQNDALTLQKYENIRLMIEQSIVNRDARFQKSKEEESNVSKTAYIYPNPFEDKFTLFCSLKTENPISLTLYNAIGEAVFKDVFVPNDIGVMEYDISPNLANGVYYYVVEVDKSTVNGKIIKMK